MAPIENTLYHCLLCGNRFPVHSQEYQCSECEGPLELECIESRPIARRRRKDASGYQAGIWVHAAHLPSIVPRNRITLGEGQTPLLRAARLGADMGIATLLLKDETQNPTGSFKDRALALAVSAATSFGAKRIVTASSGNAGIACAAYARASGVKAEIVVPRSTPQGKLLLMRLYGPKITIVEGSFADAFRHARACGLGKGTINVSSTYLNPFCTEAEKTVSYELAEQLGRRVPDWIVVPVGAGPLLYGIYKGFRELRRAGAVDRLPRMVAVQSHGCAPIARAYKQGKATVTAWKKPDTIASGIADSLQGYANDGTVTLRTVRESRGCVCTVSDSAIRRAVRQLMEMEGIFVETAAGAAAAAARKLRRQGLIQAEHEVALMITSSGVKELWNTQPIQ